MKYCSCEVSIWAKSRVFGVTFIAVGRRTKRLEPQLVTTQEKARDVWGKQSLLKTGERRKYPKPIEMKRKKKIGRKEKKNRNCNSQPNVR